MAEIKSTPAAVAPAGARKPSARPVVRWGAAALIAASAAALTAQTEQGAERLKIVLANAPEPARFVAQFQQPRPDSATGTETARLSMTVRELSADRDRLKTRIASLERALDETTGSITRQVKEVAASAESAAKKHAAAAEAIATAAPRPSEPASSIKPALMPLIALPSFSLAPAPPPGPPLAQWPNQPEQQPQAHAPANHVASLPAQIEAKREESSPIRNEFAIDLGSSPSIPALWTQWVSVKASYGPLFTGLEPLYRRHRHGSGSPDYRLILGPLPDLAAAGRLCSILSTVHVDCRTTTYEGAHLAAQ